MVAESLAARPAELARRIERQHFFRRSDDNFSATFFQSARSMPFAQEPAGREWANIRKRCEMVVVNVNLQTFGMLVTDPKAYQTESAC